MTCQKAREILSLDFPSVSKEPMASAQQHVQSCRDCRLFLRFTEDLRMELQNMERERPGKEFKERLFSEISRMRWQASRFHSRLRNLVQAAGALLVIGLLLGWYWSGGNQSVHLVDFLVKDHQENLPGQFMITSSSPAEIEEWFRGKVDFLFRMKCPPDTEILGARLCRIGGQRATLVFLRHDSHIISWFVYPGSNGRESQAATRKLVSKEGYNLVLWENGGLAEALVSDLEQDELSRLSARLSAR